MQFVKTLAGRIRGAFGRLFRMARKFFRRSAGTLGAFVCRRTVALTLLLSVSLAVTAAAVSQTRFVTIRDGDNTIVVRTMKDDPNDIIEEAGLTLSAYDAVKVNADQGLYADLSVERAFPVYLTCDGSRTVYYMTGGSVRDLLSKSDIELGVYDIMTHNPNDLLYSGIDVTINRVNYVTVTEETEIPFDVKRLGVQTIPKGKTVEKVKGENGLATVVVQNMVVDGQLLSSKVVSEEITKAPVQGVVEYGVGGEFSTSRGEALRYSHYIDLKATAYTYGESGKWGDITSTGKPVQVGYVAVDPKVIPYGTRMYITYPNGKVAYGYAVAEDTGGGIKGNRIDLFMETSAECKAFGVRKVRAYILE
ncbi:3D domain-containing protein [Feifania hominis]|uniref:G5 domain-containing protein n=1 Tax=Feifania hominis TaxID=2763660 RepID=A0A926DEV4_9FIRM|nr:3D domain-containing protein [Feifania hominis]MBC8536562.1 G5 domain-containing protein [Feifania hominis]